MRALEIYEARFQMLARAAIEWPTMAANIVIREAFLLGERERRIWESIQTGSALNPDDLNWVMSAPPFPIPPDPDSLVRSLADAARLVQVYRIAKEAEEALHAGMPFDLLGKIGDVLAQMEASRAVSALDGLEVLSQIQPPFYCFLGDPLLPIPPGRVVVVAGPPNSGKTATATGEAIRCAREGHRVLLAMAEESLALTVSRILSGVARVPLAVVREAWGNRDQISRLVERIPPEDLEALSRIEIISPKEISELMAVSRVGSFKVIIADAVYRMVEGDEVHAEIKAFLQRFAQLLIDIEAVAILTVQTSTPFTRNLFGRRVDDLIVDTTGTAYSAAFSHEAEILAYVMMPLARNWDPDLAAQFGIFGEQDKWRALEFHIAKNKPQGFPRKIRGVVSGGIVKIIPFDKSEGR